MIKLDECKQAGCEDEIAALKSRFETIEYFEREGGSFPQMALEILDVLDGREIGTYVALCYLRLDTPLIEVTEALGMLGDDGVFVSVVGEREVLKCAVGIENSCL